MSNRSVPAAAPGEAAPRPWHDVPLSLSREAGLIAPVRLSEAAWQDCVAWTETDSEAITPQDETGRLWDVLTMTRYAIMRILSGRETTRDFAIPLERVARDAVPSPDGIEPSKVWLHGFFGPDQDGRPVIKISMTGEE